MGGMDAVLHRMQNACVALANLLNDVSAREECLHIATTAVVHSSVIEYAASTLVASLAARHAALEDA